MKGSVKLPVFIDDARKYVNTTQLRAKYLGATYESEYCQWQTLHGLGSLMETASLIITPNAYLEGKLMATYPPDPIGDFDVTRATTATRVNSAGLVELVPYNLLTYSEDFTLANGYNYQNSSQSSSTIISPFGTVAKGITSTTSANDFHRFYKSATIVGATYTTSIYANKGTSRYLAIGCYHNGSASLNNVVVFDLQNGVIASNPYGVTATIQDAGNGWYRVSHTYTYTGASGIDICIHNSGNSTYVASGFQTYDSPTAPTTLYVTGIQFVEGSVAKDYQKTETRLNIPRLDYSNGICPSILVEPQRTNLLTYSEDFTNVSWVKLSSNITSNATIAPDGTNTADKLIEDNTTANHLIQKAVVSSNTSYTFSVFAKKAERNWVVLRSVNASFQNVKAWFNIDNGTIGTLENGATAKITNYSNGWYKLEMTIPSFATGFEFRISTSTGNGIDSYLGTTGSGIYIWGAQLEAGSYATSYIPTTSASVTRNADVISKTGISSLIGQTEGTIFLEFVLKNPLSATNRIISITESNWVSGGSIRLDIDYNKFTADFVNGGSNIGTIGYFTTVQPNTRYKVAIAYKENDCQMYVNGVDAGSDTTTGAMPTCSEFYLNALGGGFNAPYEASNINASALWKTRLTNTQLAQLTTI